MFGLEIFFLLAWPFLGWLDGMQAITDEFQLRLELSTDSANVGETLKAVCHVTNVGMSSSARKHYQIIWFKILPESRAEEVEIATNTFLNDEFNLTGRFKTFLQQDNPVNNKQVDFYLHIFNVQVEDSGYLGCKIGVPGITAESFKQFVVNVPVLNIWWSSPSSNPAISPTEYKQNESLSFYEGESCYFVCNVNGSYPRPQVKVFAGSEDLTRYFATSASLMRSPGFRGLQPVYYLLHVSNKSFTIEYRFNEKELKCVASMDHFFRSDLVNSVESSSVVIRVTEYRPKFFCNRRVLVELEQFNFSFSCIVRARPEVTHLNVSKLNKRRINDAHFSMSFSNNSLDLSTGPYSEAIFPDLDIQDNSPTEKLVTVVIGTLTSEELGTYVLEAMNEVGTEIYEVELHRMGHFHRYTSYHVSKSQRIQGYTFAQLIIMSSRMTLQFSIFMYLLLN